MVQFNEEAAAMTAELEQGLVLDKRFQTLGEYVATATDALEPADKSDDEKRMFLRRLSVGSGMSRGKEKIALIGLFFA